MTTTNLEKRKQTEALEVRTGSPAEMIMQAVQGNTNLEQLEKLLELQMRWEANEARKAYYKAISDFKENPPHIDKDRSVSYGQGKASYRHASLANAVEKITAALSRHGLSASWRTHQNGQIAVTCRIAHILGHYEEVTLTAPADNSGSKNSIQAIGSTVTYLQRYTLLSALGLATYDQDDDGRSAQTEETISAQELATIRDYIISTGANEQKFLGFLGIASVEEMPKSMYQRAINLFKAREKKS